MIPMVWGARIQSVSLGALQPRSGAKGDYLQPLILRSDTVFPFQRGTLNPKPKALQRGGYMP